MIDFHARKLHFALAVTEHGEPFREMCGIVSSNAPFRVVRTLTNPRGPTNNPGILYRRLGRCLLLTVPNGPASSQLHLTNNTFNEIPATKINAPAKFRKDRVQQEGSYWEGLGSM